MGTASFALSALLICIIPAAEAASVISPTKVTALLPRAPGWQGGTTDYYFNLDRAATEVGCAGGSTVGIRLDPALLPDTAFKMMVHSVMLAQAMGKTVTIYIDGCLGPYPRVYAVDVY